MRPHLLARVARAEGGPDDGVGDGHCDGTEDKIRESSAVRINLAGSFFCFFVIFANFFLVYFLSGHVKMNMP